MSRSRSPRPSGVERRGSFYEATGALRDMVPNHLFQLLSLTAMEPPNSFDADAVRTEKDKVLEAIHPARRPSEARRNVVRGQYAAGIVARPPVQGLPRGAEGVAPDSMTETYVAMQLAIDNWRWAGVPFYLRTGKALTPAHAPRSRSSSSRCRSRCSATRRSTR